jgi:hypothetical protein
LNLTLFGFISGSSGWTSELLHLDRLGEHHLAITIQQIMTGPPGCLMSFVRHAPALPRRRPVYWTLIPLFVSAATPLAGGAMGVVLREGVERPYLTNASPVLPVRRMNAGFIILHQVARTPCVFFVYCFASLFHGCLVLHHLLYHISV